MDGIENTVDLPDVPEAVADGEALSLTDNTDGDALLTTTDPDEGEKAILDQTDIKNAIETECAALSEIGLISNRDRYIALRQMGLTSREAYILTGKNTASEISKAHLVSNVPSGASSPRGGMTGAEMEAARSLFEGLSDSEIQKLYKKVTR